MDHSIFVILYKSMMPFSPTGALHQLIFLQVRESVSYYQLLTQPIPILAEQQEKFQEVKMLQVLTLHADQRLLQAFAISPQMCKILSTAEFIQTDITYNKNSEYLYHFNADYSMRLHQNGSKVVTRVWLDNQCEQGNVTDWLSKR